MTTQNATTPHDRHDLSALDAAIHNGLTVSVVIPALNEEETVGSVVRHVLQYPSFTEVIVIDADSTDDTARVATEAGAKVYRKSNVAPNIPSRNGKGDAMWRGALVSTGDIIVFMDGDLQGDVSDWAPLLAQEAAVTGAVLTKAYYRRDHGGTANGGGRTTEIGARPLLNMLYPETLDIVQPLGGEYAVTRDFIHTVTFPYNYAIEVSLLIDAFERNGKVAQVNLGQKVHTGQDTQALGRMSAQIMTEILDRQGIAPSEGWMLRQHVDGETIDFHIPSSHHMPPLSMMTNYV